MKSVFALALILVCFSCNQNSSKYQVSKTTDSQKIPDDIELIEESEAIENQKLIMKVDTFFYNYVFKYKLLESEKVLERKVVNWKGETEVLHYPEMFFEINLIVDNIKVLANTRFDKTFFEEFVLPTEISELLLYFGGISELSKEKVVLKLSLCIPDTSDCYFLYFTISTDGKFQVSEREYEW